MRGRPGLLAASLALGLSGCGAPPAETRFLNFDPESTPREALVSGWSGFESGGPGDTFVWAQGRKAAVEVQARKAGGRLVRFRCWPFRWEGAPPQTLSLAVNGSRVETLGLSGEARVYSVATPAEAWRPGKNVVTFEFAYAEAPKDRVPGQADARTLAAAFDWMEILPHP